VKPEHILPDQNHIVFAVLPAGMADSSRQETESDVSTSAAATLACLRYWNEDRVSGPEPQPWWESETDLFAQMVRETEIPPHHWPAFIDEGSALTRRYYG
jgi:hypothetical protein